MLNLKGRKGCIVLHCVEQLDCIVVTKYLRCTDNPYFKVGRQGKIIIIIIIFLKKGKKKKSGKLTTMYHLCHPLIQSTGAVRHPSKHWVVETTAHYMFKCVDVL